MLIGISPREHTLWQLLEPTVVDCSLRVVSVRLLKRGGTVLEVLVDGTTGKAGIDEIAKCARRVGRLLEVEDPIAEAFTLEVSSPGMDRPLVTLAEAQAAVGKQVRVKLVRPEKIGETMGRKTKGILLAVTDEALTVDAHTFALMDIDAITLVPDEDEIKNLLKAKI